MMCDFLDDGIHVKDLYLYKNISISKNDHILFLHMIKNYLNYFLIMLPSMHLDFKDNYQTDTTHLQEKNTTKTTPKNKSEKPHERGM